MNENNEYILQWRDCVLEAAKALNENNFMLYEDFMNKANEKYELYKRDSELTYECVNFGMSNYIFEDALPKLFKSNPKAVKEFIKTIKEDKNLLSQFQFYKAIEKCSDKIDVRDYVKETVEIVKNNIDKKTLNESNGKLAKIISRYNIKPNEEIPSSFVGLFESCDFLFKNNKKLTNLTRINECINNIVNYTNNKKVGINESNNNSLQMIDEFKKKYDSLLNEEEKSFVKEIMDFKKSDENNKKKNIFNKFKNECLNCIEKLVKESEDDEKEGLLAIKEQIESKEFNIETVVSDLAKLLEIRDVLNS